MVFPVSTQRFSVVSHILTPLCSNQLFLLQQNGSNLCDTIEMNFSESKPAQRDASEYHPNHPHMERVGSKTHPVGPPAASWQHPVLKVKCTEYFDLLIHFCLSVRLERSSLDSNSEF